MNRITILTITSLAFIYSCSNKQSSEALYSGPQVIETTGYVVPMDSVDKPVQVTIDYSKLKKVRAGKPQLVPIKSNVNPAGKPRIVKAGKPVVCTPGQDTFLMPKKVVATFNTVLAETPEIVLAKEASSKEYNPYSFSSYGIKNGLKGNCITSIFEDKAENIWISLCSEAGVTKFDGKYFANFSKNKKLHEVLVILEDKNGNIWFGGNNGVIKYDGQYFTNFTNTEIPVNTKINSLLEDTSGNIWIGTDGQGLLKYDGKHFFHFTTKNGLVNDHINDICQNDTGKICLGTIGGLSIYDGTSFSNITEKEGLSNSIVYAVLEDKAGSLWLGTYGGGVSKYAGKFLIQYTEKEGLSNNYNPLCD